MALKKKRKNESSKQKEERLAQNKAWKLMSEYTRRKYSVDEIAECVCCGDSYNWKELHAGHFIKDGICPSLRYDIDNVQPCCPTCNIWLQGNYIPYTLWMIKKYGQEKVDEMVSEGRRHTPIKRGKEEYEEIANFYQSKLNEL